MINSTKSLKQNAMANFVGISYTTIIGIIIFPLYLRYLGAEAFGLVGFFTVLQAWMQLLDMGMAPMMARQAAQARGTNQYFELKILLRCFELIFLLVALLVFVGIYAGSNWIANSWLHVVSLSLSEVSSCIVLMGIMIGLRFFASLYRSGIRGMESQVLLNIANILFVTLKFVGALCLLHFVTQEFVYFFVYQLFVGVIELICLALMFYFLIPATDKVEVRYFWTTLKPMLPFAMGIAYTAGIWVLLTQLDKMILSNILPLSEYGYFALVATVVTGINQISGPISQAILPRMTYLLSQGKEKDMLILYKKSTQLIAVLVLPLTGMIALFSTELLFAWTGDRSAAEWAGPVLFWFALGNGILAISAFQYYLQFAHGKLKMHVIYSTVEASIQIPILIYTAITYGAIGVSIAWFSIRLLSFIIWTPFVHNRFAPGIHRSWLLKDVAPSLICTVVMLFLFQNIGIGFSRMGRMEGFVVLVSLGMVVLFVNVVFSSTSRSLVYSVIKR